MRRDIDDRLVEGAGERCRDERSGDFDGRDRYRAGCGEEDREGELGNWDMFLKPLSRLMIPRSAHLAPKAQLGALRPIRLVLASDSIPKQRSALNIPREFLDNYFVTVVDV